MLAMMKAARVDYNITARKSLGKAGGTAGQDGRGCKRRTFGPVGKDMKLGQYWGRDRCCAPLLLSSHLVACSYVD